MEIDKKCINQLKVLSMDMIHHAQSGHPGVPLGCAAIIYILWTKFLKFNYINWINRDRFILSNGHGSSLLYGILYLFNYGLSLDDLKSFRNLYNSTFLNTKTTGHPERNLHNIVDVTTGPLGQGIANGVGMAISEKYLNTKINKENFSLIDHKIYVLCGDGCLMEGIAYEAISLAGHLKLNNLILLFDDNRISIDGSIDLTFSENMKLRFEAMNWNTIVVENASEDLEAIEQALLLSQDCLKPTIIFFKTIIGFGSTNQNTNKVHGNPLKIEDLNKLKKDLSFTPDLYFEIDYEVKKYFNQIRNQKVYPEWYLLLNQYKIEYPGDYLFLSQIMNNKYNNQIKLPSNIEIPTKVSTRQLSGKYLNIVNQQLDNILIGSADLGSSTCTLVDKYFNSTDYQGKYLAYGIREHAMAAIANGISTSNLIPIVSTFLVFSSYCLPAIRLSAISNHKVIYVFTHDSIALGEDGITHQPIEQLFILRSMPNLLVFRPADYNELVGCYEYMFQHTGPSCICLTRQDITNMDQTNKIEVSQGGYIIYETEANFEIIVLATGSELYTCYEVIKKLESNLDKKCRLVSIPCLELFEEQNIEYKNMILPKDKVIFSVEAGCTIGWYKYAQHCIGIDTYGASGKKDDLLKYFKLDVDGIYNQIINILI